MRMIGKPMRPGPASDLQHRLRQIEEEAKTLRRSENEQIARMAWAVEYLACILEKHLREGET